MRKRKQPEWWEEWGCNQASKQRHHYGQCIRVRSWIESIDKLVEVTLIRAKEAKRWNYLLFSRNSSGRRTVNGSFSSFALITTMVWSLSCCLSKADLDARYNKTGGQSHANGLFRRANPWRWKHAQICKNKAGLSRTWNQTCPPFTHIDTS